MGWLRSHGIIRIGTKGIDDYYIKDNWRSMLLKVDGSGYSDWFISTDCVIQFKVTSQETGDLEMQLTGDINGFPYYAGNGWNLWNDGSTWILSYISDGPGLGEPPVTSYTYNTTDSTYEYDGDEYYTGSFNYTCLDGTAGTFTKNTDGSTITLTAVWPSNFKKHTSGSSSNPIGQYEGNFVVGFPKWTGTYNNNDYYIFRVKPRKFSHLHYYDTTFMEDSPLSEPFKGYYHDQLGEPNFDPAGGFYVHIGDSNSIPLTTQTYVMQWYRFEPDEPEEGEEESHTGKMVHDSSTHPDISFAYEEIVFETDVEDDNKGLVYMTDTSCWR
jgi:hypothetical protein